ncbi:quinone oxidoreductase family protein [Lichenifustis flavocetrariae]|uniref:Zinc-binding alcohol dehydrogenase family protein n=1 Tax=Lichenifustis flavocetrariae TaxID=2949735 RepID=A0AA41Z294_9HYPH|nr:zinc-binding alcohol dehydrogenase family protein [Lichenifustis flavocetrariae]MCW6509025.1 zinc-binding alcohol dehydrogenase family protein [Lichenifustis flavocetrariae]
MKAAIVRDAGHTPVFGDFPEPPLSAGQNRVTVTAAAMSHLAKSRALGTHYSSSARFPFIAGIDGVGRLDDGKRVYFVLPQPPYGSMAERVVASSAHCIALPDDIDDLTAAAIANPGMSSWAALTERAKLKAGETVLINGATGTSGRLAVQIAEHLGAKKVIATGRNADALRAVSALGADVTISLVAGDLEERLEEQFAAGVDVVIDYLWGQSAESLLIAGAKAGADAVPIRFVQIGASSGPNIVLPSAALRSSAIELMGSGIGSIPLDRLLKAAAGVLEATVPRAFQVAFTPVPLSEVEHAWRNDDSMRRTVFTMGVHPS